MWALSNLCRGKNPPPDFTKVFRTGTNPFIYTTYGTGTYSPVELYVFKGVGRYRWYLPYLHGTRTNIVWQIFKDDNS